MFPFYELFRFIALKLKTKKRIFLHENNFDMIEITFNMKTRDEGLVDNTFTI